MTTIKRRDYIFREKPNHLRSFLAAVAMLTVCSLGAVATKSGGAAAGAEQVADTLNLAGTFE